MPNARHLSRVPTSVSAINEALRDWSFHAYVAYDGAHRARIETATVEGHAATAGAAPVMTAQAA
jgi:hypothetical protein